MNVFITGRPGSGKSTLLQQASAALKMKRKRIGGILTPEMRDEKGERTGFIVVDIASGQSGWLAKAEPGEPRVGKYRVMVEEFERVAIPALEKAIREKDVIVIDEIGKMEWLSERFRDAVAKALTSGKPVLAVIGEKLVEEFRGKGKLIEVRRGEASPATIQEILSAI
ncbi:MAG: NTPase [Candidatus Micrarchaeia archaeon]